MRKKLQFQRVLEYMQKHGSIDEMIAFQLFRVASVKSVIRKLRTMGYEIETTLEDVTYSKRKHAKYWLKRDDHKTAGCKKSQQKINVPSNVDMALNALKRRGVITSFEMRAMGIKKPSNVIIKLKRRGLHIRSKIIPTPLGRKMAIYTLIERKPPYLKIAPGREMSSYWKWRR